MSELSIHLVCGLAQPSLRRLLAEHAHLPRWSFRARTGVFGQRSEDCGRAGCRYFQGGATTTLRCCREGDCGAACFAYAGGNDEYAKTSCFHRYGGHGRRFVRIAVLDARPAAAQGPDTTGDGRGTMSGGMMGPGMMGHGMMGRNGGSARGYPRGHRARPQHVRGELRVLPRAARPRRRRGGASAVVAALQPRRPDGDADDAHVRRPGGGAALPLEHRGQTHYFCSAHCLHKLRDDP